MSALAFQLPSRLEAHEPPAERDAVRMLVAYGDGSLSDASFRELPGALAPGDLVVVNTSATLPAALPAGDLDVHLSTPLPGGAEGLWVVELRRDGARYFGASAGDVLELPGGAHVELLARYLGSRLWVATLWLPAPLHQYLGRHGRPIRYRHVTVEQPLAAYQTVFA